MTFARQRTGQVGEDLACSYLTSKGYTLINTNYRCVFGEIDIIAKHEGKIHFVEVKTRHSLKKGQPYEAVNFFKRRHLAKAAQFYVLQNKLKHYRLSIDVISILIENDKVSDLKHFQGIDVSH